MTSERERAEFEEWLGREDCPVHWDESANKNAWYGYHAGADAARREERRRCAEIATEVARQVGGAFWDTHRLNVGLMRFRERLSALDKETA